ncbi:MULTISPECIES: molybdate ABC transporter substrate-binding protein [unclassified Ruegeria]|uniref:molybdate ABC transporter substrate-binding protein n=1 Tax=unclassified Ruegeria TaxID=2625375 RepID=UPI001489422C|nr:MULTISPECIES: molybdate ABC transporter substrate-binding protein [unclassified Ruegeria]
MTVARRSLLMVMALCVVLAAPVRASAEGVLIFAAASLKTALDQIAADYSDKTGGEVTVSYAASSVLARQIQLGAPADLFISANAQWMDVLVQDGLVDATTRVDLLGNHLVLIGVPAQAEAQIDAALDLNARLDGGFLAMALVDAVPAGIYGKSALQELGLWADVEGRIAQSDNVRAALALVATGAAPLGIVYGSDALAESRVSVIGVFPSDSHPPIIYPAAATRDAAPQAFAFLTYLQTDTARAVFEAQGFTLPQG